MLRASVVCIGLSVVYSGLIVECNGLSVVSIGQTEECSGPGVGLVC